MSNGHYAMFPPPIYPTYPTVPVPTGPIIPGPVKPPEPEPNTNTKPEDNDTCTCPKHPHPVPYPPWCSPDGISLGPQLPWFHNGLFNSPNANEWANIRGGCP